MSREEAAQALADARTGRPGWDVPTPGERAAVEVLWPVIERAVLAEAAAEVRALYSESDGPAAPVWVDRGDVLDIIEAAS